QEDSFEMAALLLIYHEAYLTPYHTCTVESPARIKAIYSKVGNRFPVLRPESAERRDVLMVHEVSMVDRVQLEGRDTYEAALMSAGGAILAAETAMRGTSAFALIRPPGHHAGTDFYRGFCFFNNIAVAITRLLARGLITTALVLDLDLHDGDGTESVFRDNQAVRFVNIRSHTRTAYLEAVAHELEGSREVDLLAVSAGFDTYVHDWGGILHTDDYRAIGSMLGKAAKRFCRRRCLVVLEGGYYLPDLGVNVLAFCEGLAAR
ncbi:MAG: histone deacetylase family protein, partial [Syntrophobacteria bacterium]